MWCHSESVTQFCSPSPSTKITVSSPWTVFFFKPPLLSNPSDTSCTNGSLSSSANVPRTANKLATGTILTAVADTVAMELAWNQNVDVNSGTSSSGRTSFQYIRRMVLASIGGMGSFFEELVRATKIFSGIPLIGFLRDFYHDLMVCLMSPPVSSFLNTSRIHSAYAVVNSGSKLSRPH